MPKRKLRTKDAPDVFDEAIAAQNAARGLEVVPQDSTAAGVPADPPVKGHIANPSGASGEPGHDSALEPAAGTSARNGITRRAFPKIPERAADPFGGHTIDLSDTENGPRARFLRSKDHGDVWIQFSQYPGKQYTDQLSAEGFRWESRAHSDLAKGAWVIDLEPGNEWRNHSHAERMFMNVVNQIRQANGLEEFVPMAGKPR
jgi:hypothetical protein